MTPLFLRLKKSQSPFPEAAEDIDWQFKRSFYLMPLRSFSHYKARVSKFTGRSFDVTLSMVQSPQRVSEETKAMKCSLKFKILILYYYFILSKVHSLQEAWKERKVMKCSLNLRSNSAFQSSCCTQDFPWKA